MDLPDSNLRNQIIYFDNAATCLIDDRVMEAWNHFHQTCSGSPGRGTNLLANRASEIYENSRNKIKEFLGVDDAYEIVFCQGATDAINKISFGLSEHIKPGDIIVISEVEHNSNYLPWVRLAKQNHAYLEVIPLYNGKLDYSFLELLNDKGVAVIAITHTSNVTGYQPNLELIRDFAKQNNSLLVLDASQGVGHNSLKIAELNFDFVVVSAHKMYGPKGIGGLIGKKDAIKKLIPFNIGGGAISFFESDEIVFADIPSCHEGGTRDVASAFAWAEACRYLEEMNYSELLIKEKRLAKYLRQKLNEIPNIHVLSNGDQDDSSIISFVMDNIHSHDLTNLLNRKGIIIRTGHLCAHTYLKAMGLYSVNRISLGIHNTMEEVEYFISILEKLDMTRMYTKGSQLLLTSIDSIENYYNENILELSTKVDSRSNLILADYSADNKGRTCGDHVQLDLIVEDDKIRIGLKIQGCIHAKASGEWMIRNINGKSLDDAIYVLTKFRTHLISLSLEEDILKPWKGQIINGNQINCILTPWEALTGALKRLSQDIDEIRNNNSKEGLVCDGCVITHKLQWGTEEKEEKVILERKIHGKKSDGLIKSIRNILGKSHFQKIDKFEDKYLYYQKFGKIILKDNEKSELKHFIRNISSEEIDHLRRLRFLGILEYHCKSLDIHSLNPELYFFFTRSVMKATVQELIIKRITSIINKEEVVAVFIKGSKTRELYPIGHMRYSNDLDILTLNFDNAIKLCSALIRLENFSLPLKYGIAFSIKFVQDHNREVKLIGHYHLEKMLGNHRLNIDVSFPGLQLGLLNTTHYPQVDKNDFSYDDQFIITLTHLFKHEVPYIKDINDLYLMIKNKRVNYNNLLKLIDVYLLSFSAYLVINYITTQIDEDLIQEDLELQCFRESLKYRLSKTDQNFIQRILYKNWPYKLGPHFLGQVYDIFYRHSKNKGIKESIQDLEKIVLNKEYPKEKENENLTIFDKYSKEREVLNISLYTRLFLIPLIIFKGYIEITKKIKKLLEDNKITIYEFEKNSLIISFNTFVLLLTPTGIFLTAPNWSSQGNRAEIERTIGWIIELMQIDENLIIISRTIN